MVGGLSPALACWRGVAAFAANFPSPRADLLALHHVCSMPLLLLSQDLLANSDITYWPSGESSRHHLGAFNLVYTRQLSHAYMLLSISQQFQVVSNHQVALFYSVFLTFWNFRYFFNSQDGALGSYHHWYDGVRCCCRCYIFFNSQDGALGSYHHWYDGVVVVVIIIIIIVSCCMGYIQSKS